MIVAIDGPAGSGKGTITKIVGEKLNLINIDTGSTYRCVALKALRNGISLEEKDKIIALSKDVDITLTKEGLVFLDGEDIYSPRVNKSLLRKRVGMIFQQPNPFPMSIYDNIAYGPRIHGIKRKNKA